jgi:hypothetical protein
VSLSQPSRTIVVEPVQAPATAPAPREAPDEPQRVETPAPAVEPATKP